MAGSLRDQLLKAGAVDKKKAKQSQHQKRKGDNKKRQAVKSGQKVEDQDSTQQKIEQEQREKQQKDLDLNKQRDAERTEKALRGEVRQIVLKHKIEIPKEAEVSYNFEQDKKIKKIYITTEQQDQLTRGHLAIAIVDQVYHLIPDKMAEKIESRLPEMVIRIQPEGESIQDQNDPYADYEIPDDLMW